MYSYLMLVRLHRLPDRGSPIPKYQFAFKKPILGELLVKEERDAVLNRSTRIARLCDPVTGSYMNIPQLLDGQLVELTRERMALSGIERLEDALLLKIEDFAQTWLCWFDGE